MRCKLLRVALPLLLLAAPQARAQEVMSAVRAARGAAAAPAAAQLPDPVARKLVTFYRLISPGGASAAEIAAFMQDNPDWPLQAALAHRRDEALAAESDDAAAAAECDRPKPFTLAATAALLRCADAYGRLGRAADATTIARRAWIAGIADPAGEAHFLQRWAAAISRADQWTRFDRLAWTDTDAARRQIPRLDAADRPHAEARLALRRDDPAAPALLASLPEADRQDPAMVLEQARWLRRANQDDGALALWKAAAGEAERRAPPEHLAAFWDERNLLARRRLRQGDAEGAYALAAGHAQTGGESLLEAEFLAGFIALRKLKTPDAAMPHFSALAAVSKAAITQGRAHFSLARSFAAQGDATSAAAEFAAAATFPSTFYGQLAALALGQNPAARIADTPDPPADPQRTLEFAGRELARAAVWLVSWGEPGRAQPFLVRLDDTIQDPADHALLARLATGFGLPEAAVALARRAGRDGITLLQTGWPAPADIPPDAGIDPALALAIIRQESSFDPTTVSPAGARGLMQLMPATATQVARQLGLHVAIPALTAEPRTNIRLGTAYLRQLLDQFGGSVPLAVAAYNAGPGHVQEWLAANGDPRTETTDMVDWIELIPFRETRNYVQRVIENLVVYRARRGEDSKQGQGLCPWTPPRGSGPLEPIPQEMGSRGPPTPGGSRAEPWPCFP
jgi:soluble lytic murein transglycosylase